MTHTPGPWSVGIGIPRPIQSDLWDHIADVLLVANGDIYANARLIAAAPELLEALEAYHERAIVDSNGVWEKAESAIRKATGE